ncbi:SAM-dependent methyltransferase [Streptomyces griseocarneus]|nr:SAM-dependent methyltransferase [Streptomyces griseocarneus]
MPTLPPRRVRTFDTEPHQHRDVAESFGTDAERYDRTRPRYPDGLLERIVASSPGPDVLDVGCGTGISARQLQERGCRVLGVEPDARMAGLARRSGVEVDVTTFEAWEPDGREFDAVVAGQAWHWVDPVAGAAKAARALRPGGLLALFWNVHQPPPEVTEAFATACRRLLPDSPFDLQGVAQQSAEKSYYGPMLTKAADRLRETGGFDDPQEWRVEWECPYTRDAWLDQLPTQGPLTQLPPDTLEQVLQAVGAAIDAMGGSFTMRYVTVAVAAHRTGG